LILLVNDRVSRVNESNYPMFATLMIELYFLVDFIVFTEPGR